MHVEESGNQPKTQKIIFLGFLFFTCMVFVALGVWQLYRLQWKNALIEQVDQRVHASVVPAPSSDMWPGISIASDEYRHVIARGVFLYQDSVAVQASTELGPGFWLLTPLQLKNGDIIYVNRGFIKSPHPYLDFDQSNQVQPVAVTGLLRMGEPKGGFLHTNNPVLKRWYSRDVQALALSQHLLKVAPFFIDAQEVLPLDQRAPINPEGGEAPVMGLTVIHFPNNHLVYALTWFALAGMALFAIAKPR